MTQQRSPASPPLELVLGALGGLLVAALLAFLAYQAAAVPDRGAELRVTVESLERTGSQLVAHVRVKNDGGETAEGVGVAGTLHDDGDVVERATTTLSYVPAQSSRRAALVFSGDPANPELSVGVTGYAFP